MSHYPPISIVADIGGTNIRIAQARNGKVVEVKSYQCARFSNLDHALQCYFDDYGIDPSQQTVNACLAIACPVDQDEISMTNLPWAFSKSVIQQQLGLAKLLFINDYTAIAHAVPLLTEQQKVQIGEGAVIERKPIAICGPGTGLGVAHLIPTAAGWQCLSGEGGHIDFAPVDEDEINILRFIQKTKPRVSYEQLLSGYGLEQVYQAIVHEKSLVAEPLSAENISQRALSGDCPLCLQALNQFCRTLGSFAGNLALLTGCFGGVYIAGGIVPRFIDFIQQSEFRQRFETKGRLSPFIKNIPTYVITEPQPGLLGAAAYLNQEITEVL